MPTVLQVLPSLAGGGGVERGTLDISRALVAAGWRSVIVSEREADREQAADAGAHHAALPVARRSPVQAPGAIRLLARLIAEEGVDLVHARSRWPAWLACYAARRTERPFVTTFHGAYSTGWPGKHHYNAIMARGARVIAISEFIARHVVETYRVTPDRIRTIPRGVDLSAFDPARVGPERIAALRNAWRVPDGRPIVMLPGRLTGWKGHLALLDALARVEESVCCLFVGTVEAGHAGYRARVERRITALGPAHTSSSPAPVGTCRRPTCWPMSWSPPRSGRRRSAVSPPRRKPWGGGRSLRPMAGHCETVLDGETGWLVPPGDADALAHAIRQALAASPAERERMAAAGQAHVRRNFTLDGMCSATLDVYRELLPGQS